MRCDLDLVPHVAKAGQFEYALFLGLAAPMAPLIFKRV